MCVSVERIRLRVTDGYASHTLWDARVGSLPMMLKVKVLRF